MEGSLADMCHLFVTVFLSYLATFMVIPAITDVTMSALCPGQSHCSLAIYLSGFQQAVTGLGSVVMMPLIGNLSDKYGRKAMLTLPMTISIVPLVILAYRRTTNFFYAYYLFKTITAMVTNGSLNCLALAYVADVVSDGQRASAFGILSGVVSAAYVFGTLATRCLTTGLAFQIAASVSIVAAVYMRIFLKESVENLTQPILKEAPDDIEGHSTLLAKATEFKAIPSPRDLFCLLKISPTFSQAAVIAFFNSLAEGGVEVSLLYFLKARFNFNKDQYAVLMLIGGVTAMVMQLLFVPLLTPFIAEERLLSVALFGGFTYFLLYSIAWSKWVPYANALLSAMIVIVPPCLGSIASKQIGPNEQGKAQGCIQGINSLATVISPIIFSPLTVLFFSEEAPFNFPGFSILCIGFAMMISFIQSVFIRAAAPIPNHKISFESEEG
ncbi:hypothetical protein K2173_010549 [Erythroxylum novogranatense]|uniref:Major facilitator superfamily (MFS) profile domain-containing protein n=1 Tax=Erythroxylum novogranatense TaxID=1862640 RepID=A0AAV8TDX9_9ROSI|nr:hypothetical protein K2173_010549 [Erythroxylum novogranatense]